MPSYGGTESVDFLMLEQILDAGGEPTQFVEHLSRQFKSDVERILDRVVDAARRDDAITFEHQVHLLRSVALQIGAVTLSASLAKPSLTAEDDLVDRARDIVASVRPEAARVVAALAAYRARRSDGDRELVRRS